jgi:BirA family biotin operon repressor/biotin-[acetyl-CoA-carboxylase] ligase
MPHSDSDYSEASCSEDECLILQSLLDAPDAFVSGSRLAEQLGISRPAVWAKLEKLREQGFEFEAVRNRGYRLVHEPQLLHPALIRYYLQQQGTEMDVLYFPVIDSTNSEAERQMTYARPSPFAVASSCQTKGRGRLGREWYSASADNLYLSVVFEPNIPPQQLQHFTLWAGIYICRALQQFVPNAALQIKWPNDLHCRGRKFAGMLTEAKMDADRLRSIVFGIGINLNSNPNSFPSALKAIATSLYAINGEEVPFNSVTACVVQAISRAYATCMHDSSSERLPEAWAPLDALHGKMVTALQGGRSIAGVASGIDASGALLLQAADGTLQTVRAGDVTLKKN